MPTPRVSTEDGDVPESKIVNTQHMTRSLEGRGGVDGEWYTSCQDEVKFIQE